MKRESALIPFAFLILCLAVVALGVKVWALTAEKRADWNKSSRTSMLIQEAYNEGFYDGKYKNQEGQ